MKYKSAFVVKNALIRNSSHVKAKKNQAILACCQVVTRQPDGVNSIFYRA